MPASDPPLDLSRRQRIHVVGVGGAGMSGMATILAAMGHDVTGSDLKASPVTVRLESQGIGVLIGHRPEQVDGVDVVTYSPAVDTTNPELAEARRHGIRVARRATVLGAIAGTRRTIAVAGTHGKTTTTSMLGLTLVEAGLRPSILVGADVNEFGTNAVWDSGDWLVLEADESFGAFEELRPEVGVLISVEPDHLDYYGSVEGLRQAFAGLLSRCSGPTVVGIDDPEAAAVGAGMQSIGVGEAPGGAYRMSGLALSRNGLGFDLSGSEGLLGRIEVPVPGAHNAHNAALAAVTALLIGVPFDDVAAALARFTGVPRRFEFRGEANGVTFVDDYAHLPSEVRAALATARTGEWERVVAVFQPHRYSRTGALAATFADAFADADVVVVTDVYGAGETPVPGVSGKLVADAVAARHPDAPVVYAGGRDELRAMVAALLRPGDVCCTLGAGDLTTLPDELLASPTW